MNTSSNSHAAGSDVEAARYALMRRLLPVLRHHMVVHLQPIGMIYEVLDRKLGSEQPDMRAARDGMAKINQLARSAVASCLDVVSWLAPDDTVAADIQAGVNDCVELLRSNFMFRGFTISSEIAGGAVALKQSALREVLTAAMIATTDSAKGPMQLVVNARSSAGEALVTVSTRPGDGSGFASEMAYRAIRWDDVKALAQANSVRLTLQPPGVELGFAL